MKENKMQITVTIREVYGIKTIYPVCVTAKTFASIAGTKTLTLATLKKIEALGYQIMQELPEPLTL